MMVSLRTLAVVAALAATLLASSGKPAAAAETSGLVAKLETIYLTAYDEALNRHVSVTRDGTTYVSTGDIEAEWLRDASAVVEPYIGLAMNDTEVAKKLRGVVARQARYILMDPYANAFSRKRTFEHKVWTAGKIEHGARNGLVHRQQDVYRRGLRAEG